MIQYDSKTGLFYVVYENIFSEQSEEVDDDEDEPTLSRLINEDQTDEDYYSRRLTVSKTRGSMMFSQFFSD